MIIHTRRYIAEAFALATVITGGSLLISGPLLGNEINWWETASVFFSFACTWLCTRQVRFNYVLAVISTCLLSYVFWEAHLYGSMALNLYLIPTVIYGYFIWGRDTNPRPVEHVQPSRLIWYLLVTAITWYGAYQIITYFDGVLGHLDGWLLVGSIFAQFLLDRKKIETWIVWALVNIVSIYVYYNSGLYLLSFQFFLFLINTMIAWRQWKKSMDAGEPR